MLPEEKHSLGSENGRIIALELAVATIKRLKTLLNQNGGQILRLREPNNRINYMGNNFVNIMTLYKFYIPFLRLWFCE